MTVQASIPYRSFNPNDGKLLREFDQITDAELENKLAAANKAFRTWRTVPFAEKAAMMSRAAAILRAQEDRFASLVTREMGKLLVESRGEVQLSADILDYYADNAERMMVPEPIATPQGEAFIESDPIGVLLGVEPWNFPYYQLARFAAPNIMAGNVVMVKHAESVPQCAVAFEELFAEAGAPAGIYSNIFASFDQVASLIDDPRIRGVALTGSERAGSVVAAQAAKKLKKSTMELGGSDAFVILEDADPAETLKWALWGKMNNGGQCCVAAKRFIVVESRYDEFVEKFTASMAALKMGDPTDPGTTLAPMSSEKAVLTLADQVGRAVAAGATLRLGGNRAERPGYFFEATVLTEIAPGNPAYYEELFGPVALIFRVKDEAAAIELANDSPFGLGGSVFTTDIARGKRVASQIDTGMVFINHPTWTAPELPFGGVKNSGYGRELSGLGIQEFLNKKLIRVATPNSAY
ncbi:NAD-dependent succinate-semialdehyde dehydrogenase [Rhizobium sp. P44RR-XXIV]|uniref:NAD-dependent succinate-semialdehyde dehydrogenase n=1 Tax=Rhizobium sp. P44RR-XXIV TaxID=1921145 RepID=UPI000987A8B3|nr:NAD-dependent succinate-semialdehyde dehydrogenase [Rhizobium sp. P44RR-XXIV]